MIGVPQPVLKWYKDGVELKPGDIHRIISGQDGKCCLGTYTCEARNCMGIVASSASILGFDDASKTPPNTNGEPLQRNYSLSTINEERSSQLYGTPAADITQSSDISFSFDGKEVSVSLYETPDLTEQEALQIVEMYADQISEQVTEHNVVELPPLRFVKETSQSGNLLMEAVIIDVASEYFLNEDDMRTEADMDNVSINEVSLHGMTAIEYSEAEDDLTFDGRRRADETEISGEMDNFFSLSEKTRMSDTEDNTEDPQTFASARDSDKNQQMECNANDLEESSSRSIVRKRKISSSQTDESAKRQIIDAEQNVSSIVPLAVLTVILEHNMQTIKGEVNAQSALMMSTASVDGSLTIINNLMEPIRVIRQKLNEYNGSYNLEELFDRVRGDLEKIHQALTIIEKCVAVDEDGHTMIQRTSVCIIESVGQEFIQLFDSIESIASNAQSPTMKIAVNTLVNDIRTGIQITQNMIVAQGIAQEANAREMAQHINDTVKRIQDIPESIPFDQLSTKQLPMEALNFKNVCRSIVQMQKILDANGISASEMLQNLMDPIDELGAEIRLIEQILNAATSGNDEALEEKINIILWDTVTPPMYELFKALEILEAKQPAQVSDIIETIMPPLQEIQNGLARIGQDIENCTLDRRSPPIENTDINRLTESVTQSLVYFGSNIEAFISNNMLHKSLSVLHGQLSNMVTASIAWDDNSRTSTLNCFKKSIDDLNYCFRQMEERHALGSIQDILGPLQALEESLKNCGEGFTGGSEMELFNSVRCQIESVLQNILHTTHTSLPGNKDDITEACSAPSPNESFDSHGAYRTEYVVAQLDKANRCVSNFHQHLLTEQVVNDESSACIFALAKPLQGIGQSLTELQDIVARCGVNQNDSTQDDQIQSVSKMVEPLAHVCESLQMLDSKASEQLASTTDLSELKMLAAPLKEVNECITAMQYQANTLIAKPIIELQCNIETILHQICYAADDLSTIDDISNNETVAEKLPSDDVIFNIATVTNVEANDSTPRHVHRIISLKNSLYDIQHRISKQTHSSAMAELNDQLIQTIAQFNRFDSAPNASMNMEQFAASLQHLHIKIANTKRFVTDINVDKLQQLISQMQKELFTTEQINHSNGANMEQITIIQFGELHRCVVTMPEPMPDVLLALNSVIKQHDAPVFASIEKSIQKLRQIVSDHPNIMNDPQEMQATDIQSPLLILKQQTQSLDETTIQRLHKMSFSIESNTTDDDILPIVDLIVCIDSISLQSIECITRSVEPVIVSSTMNDIDHLKRCIANTQQKDIYKAIQEISRKFGSDAFERIVQPLLELQHYVEIIDNEPTESISEMTSVSHMREFGRPLMEIRDFVQTHEEVLQMCADVSERDHFTGHAQPIVELFQCVQQMNNEVFEQLNDLSTQADVTEWQLSGDSDEDGMGDFVQLRALERCINNINELGTIDVLEDLSAIDSISELRTLAKPIRDLRDAVICEENHPISVAESMSEMESVRVVAKIAKPIAEIREYVASTIGQQELMQLAKELSETDDLKTHAEPILDLLECIDKFSPEILEPKHVFGAHQHVPQLNTHDDISEMDTITECLSIATNFDSIGLEAMLNLNTSREQLKYLVTSTEKQPNSKCDGQMLVQLINEVCENIKELRENMPESKEDQFYEQHTTRIQDALQTFICNKTSAGCLNNQINDIRNSLMALANIDTMNQANSVVIDEKFTEMLVSLNQMAQIILEGVVVWPIEKEQELRWEADELIRISQERQITLDEHDRLKDLLAKIQKIDDTIHATVFDAKIINKNTAELFEQLKDDLETRDEIKKNDNFGGTYGENLSAESVRSIDTKNTASIHITDAHKNDANQMKIQPKNPNTYEEQEPHIDDSIHRPTHIAEKCTVDDFMEGTTIFEDELNSRLGELQKQINVMMVEVDQNVPQALIYIQQALDTVKSENSLDIQTCPYLLAGLRQAIEAFEESDVYAIAELKNCVCKTIVCLEDMMKPPIEAVMSHLDRTNDALVHCCETVSVSTCIISDIQKPLTDLINSIKYMSDFIAAEPLQKISRNTVQIQQFIADLQTIESQLFFVQRNCVDSKSLPMHANLGAAVLIVKKQLEIVQNTIQYSEDIHPLLLTKAVDLLSHPVNNLNDICNRINQTVSSEASIIEQSIRSEAMTIHTIECHEMALHDERVTGQVEDGPAQCKVRTDSEILMDEFKFSASNMQSCVEMLLNGKLLTLDSYKILSRKLMSLNEMMNSMQYTTDDIQEIANFLSDIKEKLESINPEELASAPSDIAEIAYGELMMLEKSVCDALGCVEDMHVTPIEAVIAHLERPIRSIENCLRLVQQIAHKINVRNLDRPLNEMKTSMCILGAYILRDPLLHISKSSMEIQAFITELQSIESQLHSSQYELSTMSDIPYNKELSDAVAMVKLQITDTQNEIQYTESIHPILITKTVDKLCKPIDLVRMIIESLCEVLYEDVQQSETSALIASSDHFDQEILNDAEISHRHDSFPGNALIQPQLVEFGIDQIDEITISCQTNESVATVDEQSYIAENPIITSDVNENTSNVEERLESAENPLSDMQKDIDATDLETPIAVFDAYSGEHPTEFGVEESFELGLASEHTMGEELIYIMANNGRDVAIVEQLTELNVSDFAISGLRDEDILVDKRIDIDATVPEAPVCVSDVSNGEQPAEPKVDESFKTQLAADAPINDASDVPIVRQQHELDFDELYTSELRKELADEQYDIDETVPETPADVTDASIVEQPAESQIDESSKTKLAAIDKQQDEATVEESSESKLREQSLLTDEQYDTDATVPETVGDVSDTSIVKEPEESDVEELSKKELAADITINATDVAIVEQQDNTTVEELSISQLNDEGLFADNQKDITVAALAGHVSDVAIVEQQDDSNVEELKKEERSPLVDEQFDIDETVLERPVDVSDASSSEQPVEPNVGETLQGGLEFGYSSGDDQRDIDERSVAAVQQQDDSNVEELPQENPLADEQYVIDTTVSQLLVFDASTVRQLAEHNIVDSYEHGLGAETLTQAQASTSGVITVEQRVESIVEELPEEKNVVYMEEQETSITSEIECTQMKQAVVQRDVGDSIMSDSDQQELTRDIHTINDSEMSENMVVREELLSTQSNDVGSDRIADVEEQTPNIVEVKEDKCMQLDEQTQYETFLDYTASMDKEVQGDEHSPELSTNSQIGETVPSEQHTECVLNDDFDDEQIQELEVHETESHQYITDEINIEDQTTNSQLNVSELGDIAHASLIEPIQHQSRYDECDKMFMTIEQLSSEEPREQCTDITGIGSYNTVEIASPIESNEERMVDRVDSKLEMPINTKTADIQSDLSGSNIELGPENSLINSENSPIASDSFQRIMKKYIRQEDLTADSPDEPLDFNPNEECISPAFAADSLQSDSTYQQPISSVVDERFSKGELEYNQIQLLHTHEAHDENSIEKETSPYKNQMSEVNGSNKSNSQCSIDLNEAAIGKSNQIHEDTTTETSIEHNANLRKEEDKIIDEPNKLANTIHTQITHSDMTQSEKGYAGVQGVSSDATLVGGSHIERVVSHLVCNAEDQDISVDLLDDRTLLSETIGVDTKSDNPTEVTDHGREQLQDHTNDEKITRLTQKRDENVSHYLDTDTIENAHPWADINSKIIEQFVVEEQSFIQKAKSTIEHCFATVVLDAHENGLQSISAESRIIFQIGESAVQANLDESEKQQNVQDLTSCISDESIENDKKRINMQLDKNHDIDETNETPFDERKAFAHISSENDKCMNGYENRSTEENEKHCECETETLHDSVATALKLTAINSEECILIQTSLMQSMQPNDIITFNENGTSNRMPNIETSKSIKSTDSKDQALLMQTSDMHLSKISRVDEKQNMCNEMEGDTSMSKQMFGMLIDGSKQMDKEATQLQFSDDQRNITDEDDIYEFTSSDGENSDVAVDLKLSDQSSLELELTIDDRSHPKCISDDDVHKPNNGAARMVAINSEEEDILSESDSKEILRTHVQEQLTDHCVDQSHQLIDDELENDAPVDTQTSDTIIIQSHQSQDEKPIGDKTSSVEIFHEQSVDGSNCSKISYDSIVRSDSPTASYDESTHTYDESPENSNAENTHPKQKLHTPAEFTFTEIVDQTKCEMKQFNKTQTQYASRHEHNTHDIDNTIVDIRIGNQDEAHIFSDKNDCGAAALDRTDDSHVQMASTVQNKEDDVSMLLFALLDCMNSCIELVYNLPCNCCIALNSTDQDIIVHLLSIIKRLKLCFMDIGSEDVQDLENFVQHLTSYTTDSKILVKVLLATNSRGNASFEIQQILLAVKEINTFCGSIRREMKLDNELNTDRLLKSFAELFEYVQNMNVLLGVLSGITPTIIEIVDDDDVPNDVDLEREVSSFIDEEKECVAMDMHDNMMDSSSMTEVIEYEPTNPLECDSKYEHDSDCRSELEYEYKIDERSKGAHYDQIGLTQLNVADEVESTEIEPSLSDLVTYSNIDHEMCDVYQEKPLNNYLEQVKVSTVQPFYMDKPNDENVVRCEQLEQNADDDNQFDDSNEIESTEGNFAETTVVDLLDIDNQSNQKLDTIISAESKQDDATVFDIQNTFCVDQELHSFAASEKNNAANTEDEKCIALDAANNSVDKSSEDNNTNSQTTHVTETASTAIAGAESKGTDDFHEENMEAQAIQHQHSSDVTQEDLLDTTLTESEKIANPPISGTLSVSSESQQIKHESKSTEHFDTSTNSTTETKNIQLQQQAIIAKATIQSDYIDTEKEVLLLATVVVRDKTNDQAYQADRQNSTTEPEECQQAITTATQATVCGVIDNSVQSNTKLSPDDLDTVEFPVSNTIISHERCQEETIDANIDVRSGVKPLNDSLSQILDISSVKSLEESIIYDGRLPDTARNSNNEKMDTSDDETIFKLAHASTSNCTENRNGIQQLMKLPEKLCIQNASIDGRSEESIDIQDQPSTTSMLAFDSTNKKVNTSKLTENQSDIIQSIKPPALNWTELLRPEQEHIKCDLKPIDVQDQPKRHRPNESKPTFESRLTNRHVSFGSSTKLTCSYIGHHVRVQWFHNGKRLLPNDKFNINTAQSGITSLRITNINFDDGGQYSCNLSNTYGECESCSTITIFEEPVQPVVIERRQSKQRLTLDADEMNLIHAQSQRMNKIKIVPKPVIESRLRNRTVDANANVQLMCSFSGRNCSVRWLKDDLQIRNDDIKYRSSESEGFAYLHIMNVDANDGGEYRCTISNTGGQSETSCHITIVSYETQNMARQRNIRIDTLNDHLTCEDSPLPSIILTNIKGTIHDIFMLSSVSRGGRLSFAQQSMPILLDSADVSW